MDTDILKIILSCHGSVEKEELECNIGDAASVAEIITNNHDKFVSCLSNGESRVVVRSPVRLCRSKECPGCERLHLCKNMLFSGDCHFLQSRRGCSFSHDLHSDYNKEVLKEFDLETLSRTELCLLLLQSDNTLLPPICHNYNNRGGCQGECPRLHICERVLSRDCNCFRWHDFSEPQPLKLLQDKHIPDHLFKVLKSIYANKQALRLADKGKRRNETGSQAVVSEYEAEDGSQGAQMSSEVTPMDWAAYDSDSSSSICTNPNESGHHPRKREGKRRDRSRRGNMQKSFSGAASVNSNCTYKQYTSSQVPKTCEEMCNSQQYISSPPDKQCSRSGKQTDLDASNTAGTDTRAKSIGRQSQRGKDKTEICMFFIRGDCKHKENCLKVHDKMPYRWEIKQSGQWTPMADNEKIEKDYCDPQNTYSTTCPPVHFNTMMCGKNKVRRLCTLNSIIKPHYSHTTEWLWYFKDEKGQWNPYSAAMNICGICDQRLIIITSEELEQRYLKYPEDVVLFSSGSQSYKLSFQEMAYINQQDGTKQLVRRRPRFISAAEVQTKRKCPTLSNAAPVDWDKTQTLQTSATNTNTFLTSPQQTALKTIHHMSAIPATLSPTLNTKATNPSPSSESESSIKSQFTLTTTEATLTTMSATKSSNPFFNVSSSGSQLPSIPSKANTLCTFPTSAVTNLATNAQMTTTKTSANLSATSERKSPVTSHVLQTKSAPTSLDIFSASTTNAQLISTTALPTNYQSASHPALAKPFPSTTQSPSKAQISSATPQTTFAFDFATPTTNKMATTPYLALETKPSNQTDLSSSSQLTTTKSQFTIVTSQNTAVIPCAVTKSGVTLTTVATTLETKSSELISSSAHQSKSHFPYTAEQSRSVSSQVAPKTMSSNTFSTSNPLLTNLSSSKSPTTSANSAVASRCSFTTPSEPKLAESPCAFEVNSPNAFSGVSTRSQLAAKSRMTTQTSAAKSQLSSQTIIAKSNCEKMTPKTVTKTQFESSKCVDTSISANVPTVTYSSASPFGHAAVTFPGATGTGSTTATKQKNNQKKSCVIV